MTKLISFARLPATLIVAVILSGCQTLGRNGLVASTVTAELSPEAAEAIAGDMTEPLIEQIGPGTTTLVLVQDGSVFGQVFETTLRGQGYGIANDQTAEGAGFVPIAYVVDNFEGSVLVRISLSSVELTRVYNLSAIGAEPTSPLSVMKRSPATSL